MSRLGDAWTSLLEALADEPDEASARRFARWMADRLAKWPPPADEPVEVPTWRTLQFSHHQAEINRRGKLAALAMLRSRQKSDQTDDEGGDQT